MRETFYKKVGKRYVPVAEYDNQLMDSFPKGHHLISCQPGITSRRFNIEPNYAAMIAAGIVAEDVISKKLVEASDLRPSKTPITEEQRIAWNNLKKSFGNETHCLQWPSAREACQEAVKEMQKEASKLLENPSVRRAYDHFMLMCQLTKKDIAE